VNPHPLEKELGLGIDDLVQAKPPRDLFAPPALRNILVAVDGTQDAANAVALACAVAQPGVSLSLVSVGARDGHADLTSSTLFERSVANPAAAIQAAKALAEKAGVPIGNVHAPIGTPLSEIPRVARDEAADLVVFGSGSLGRLEFEGTGSTAKQLKAAVAASVLIARTGLRGPILCPVDGSPTSRSAASLALRLASAWGVPLTVLHVRDPPIRPELPKPRRRDAFVWRHPEPVAFLAQQGHSSTVILDHAQRDRAGLIVIGSRGFSNLTPWGLGSTSDAVASQAPCNVLIVKVAPSA
jgi:nucleotide-binding universal stress UspA family protein